MKWLTGYIKKIMVFCLRRKTRAPRRLPQELPPDVLQVVLQEARFLHKNQVDVRDLAPGEHPGIPRCASEDTPADVPIAQEP